MPTQAVYRANITSYAAYSTDQLISYIQDWGTRESLVQTQTNENLVVRNCTCPTTLNDSFVDICSQLQVLETTQVLDFGILIRKKS